MAVKDDLAQVLEKLEHPVVRWVLVGVGVLILLRLRLILFAAALPVMAYWHYSNQDAPEPDGVPGDGADDGTPWYPQDADDGMGKFDSGAGAPDLDPAAEEVDPYDQSFWAGDSPGSDPARRSAPSKGSAKGFEKKDFGSPWHDDGDDFPAPKSGGGSAIAGDKDVDLDKFLGKSSAAPDDVDLDKFLGKTGGSATDDIDLDKFLGNKDPFGGGMGGSGDLDFGLGSLGGGLGDDMDFLSSGFGGGGKGGKGKGKRDKDKGKGDREKGKGPQEPNPKQVFVAGIGDLAEDDIRMFFEDAGEVDRLKVLKNDEGQSKGVCFVTFRTEEQAQKALGLNGSDCMGRRITVRLAHGGKGKDDRGGGSKGGFGGDRDRGGFGDRDREPPLSFGRSERFGDAFGDERGMDRRDDRKGGKGKGRGRMDRGELDDALEEALADSDGPVRAGDFDFAARRFLSELKSQDRVDGTSRFQEAMDMVIKYTSSKDRSSVRKWPAYIFTLLQKFDPKLWDELRERDAERRREKGGGGFGRGPRDDREDRL